jgi:uncharacterized protein (UPF0212 family)
MIKTYAALPGLGDKCPQCGEPMTTVMVEHPCGLVCARCNPPEPTPFEVLRAEHAQALEVLREIRRRAKYHTGEQLLSLPFRLDRLTLEAMDRLLGTERR